MAISQHRQLMETPDFYVETQIGKNHGKEENSL